MKIVAHRGNGPGFKELTRAGYEHALSLPIHGVETDVRLCRSGELVLHHDARLGRTDVGINGVARISGLSLEQLRRINFGTRANPQEILTLPEMLGLIKDAGDKHLYLEIKKPTRYGRMLEEQVTRALAYAGLRDDERIHIISFSHTCLRRMAELTPALDRFYLRGARDFKYNPKDIMFSKPTGLGMDHRVAKLRPELVGALGLPTYLWTPNTPADLLAARDAGADIITTDDAELALEVFAPANARV
ncbi:glycerophosphodiester phosphodiesterase family protein [Corynebacterium uterequi]|uniref:Glycerophosphoryl diester phosphodiesterase n=1 Tax=Corynebacterium uterequi TaxID=1072256 RepID=A0A0G3HFH2_9CORY|nr:glycerophosphodiester phosphodiesterase family protein [Corynebacterium uterequi]AKK12101.1 glycerophosphoryl diester phosphodiesterase [Corynebacterium uterequi]